MQATFWQHRWQDFANGHDLPKGGEGEVRLVNVSILCVAIFLRRALSEAFP